MVMVTIGFSRLSLPRIFLIADGGTCHQVKLNTHQFADVKHEICKAYDVEHPEAGVAFRGSAHHHRR
ncbi:hypothetical protein OH492_23960 [Vibrio chagasii]|nr:hypothetical protein [Vibrio chagasii]